MKKSLIFIAKVLRSAEEFLKVRKYGNKSITFVFCFLGEFGYELLNWQGRIRQLSALDPNFTFIVAGKSATRSLYENFESFISLDAIRDFNYTQANGYFANSIGRDIGLLGQFITDFLRRQILKKHLRHYLGSNSKYKYIFSDQENEINGIKFGANRFLFGWPGKLPRDYNDSIYEKLDLTNNLITKLSDVNLPLSNELCVMRASRTAVIRDAEKLDDAEICSALERRFGIHYLEFKGVRLNDTEGRFRNGIGSSRQFTQVSDLGAQVLEIAKHKLCVFFTEGDLRSHTYIPPLSGVNVIVVTTPGVVNRANYVAKWNQEVFTFGGQLFLFPWRADRFEKSLEELVKKINSLL